MATQTDILIKLFQDAAADLKEIVLHPPGGTASGQDFRRARAAELITRINAILKKLDAKSIDWIRRNAPAAFREGMAEAERQARELGMSVPPIVGSFSVVPQHAVEVLAHDIAADLNKASDAMGQQAIRLIRATAQRGLGEAQIDTILAGGIIHGEPVQAIRALRQALELVHGETVPITDKNGDVIHFKAGYYAKLVAVTKTRQATEIGRHRRLQSLGMDLVSIVGRSSKNFCSAFLGKVFSLSGRSRKYPSLSVLPNGLHGNHGPPFPLSVQQIHRRLRRSIGNGCRPGDGPGSHRRRQIVQRFADRSPAAVQGFADRPAGERTLEKIHAARFTSRCDGSVPQTEERLGIEVMSMAS